MGRQRGGTRRPSGSNGTQQLADLQRRMGHQQERWKETTRRIRWRLHHPRPTLKQSLGEKKRQVTFEARHLFRKGLPGRPNKTRRGLLAGGVAAGIMAPVVGGILSHVIKQAQKNIKARREQMMMMMKSTHHDYDRVTHLSSFGLSTPSSFVASTLGTGHARHPFCLTRR